jgi:hypothetical protein
MYSNQVHLLLSKLENAYNQVNEKRIGGKAMNNYSMLYRLLFNAITSAIEQLENQKYESAKTILKMAQQSAEDIYIQSDD